MATVPARKRPASSLSSPGQSLSLIVGLACIVGFVIDVLILSLPPEPLNIQWRINVLQQVGDRSIVLLLGLALTMYGLLDMRGLRRQFSLLCLAIGVMFALSGVLVLRDSLKFQNITLNNISSQEAQVRSQIETARANPQNLAPEITPEALQEASQVLTQRAEAARNTTKTGVIKVAASSVGNLIVTGLALIAIGRFGNRLRG
jgi:hypothetical protein